VTDLQSSLLWSFATLPKANSAPAENEDALGTSAKLGRFAIADGASEGWQSGPWSRSLVKAYLKHVPSPADFDRWIAHHQKYWAPPDATGPTAWYAEAKREQGSFATLLGLAFSQAKSGDGLAWKALAVGDSCLLLVRNGELQSCWPVETLAGFHNSPSLLPSSMATQVPEPEWLAGRCYEGDLFLLATDAVAAGLMQMATRNLWRSVRTALSRDGATERTAGLLELIQECQARRNDDVTLLAVAILPLQESE